MKKQEQDLSKLSVEELTKQAEVAAVNLNKLRFSHRITPLANPSQIREQRRQVARLQTELNKRKNAGTAA